MKIHIVDFRGRKSSVLDKPKKLFQLILPLFLLGIIPFYLYNNHSAPMQSLSIVFSRLLPSAGNLGGFAGKRLKHACEIFSGDWVPHVKGLYYTNTSNCVIDDRQNCMKFGRPDSEFMHWRWKPDQCELPLFDAVQFLKLVRGKSMAFVGDSLARNQMQSLVCLLATAASPLDVSYVKDERFSRWFYVDYNFTLAALWSTHLIKSYDADPNGYSLNSLMNLYLDEVDEAWASQIENFNYVVISAGPWFFRPFMYYENGGLVGCHVCNKENITSLSRYYGYRMALRTAFRTLLNRKYFKGVTFLRTFSPPHYDNGDWDNGGNCARTRPFKKQETKLDDYIQEFYLTQTEEIRAAEKKGRKLGLKFKLLDITDLMLLRPDGHPNHYGHWPNANVTVADCVHWCLPGPLDTWNEILLYMLKMEA